MEQFPKISHDINIMGGKACIKGTRVTVGMIMAQLSGGKTADALVGEYPYLSHGDISEALRYAAWLAVIKNSPHR
ncbi:MAG: DUF433 domain-containing protein [Defluviitaleaceae bacterium]|nr:DUF433 domain-containing protein [Defluviitaleaceae bacterium]